MEKMFASSAWVIISDGRQALLIGDQGTELFSAPRAREGADHADTQDHAFESEASRCLVRLPAPSLQNGVEHSNRCMEEEEDFATKLAARLNDLVIAGIAKHLIIAAPMHVLELARKKSSAAVRSAIYASLTVS
jgi:protein required for attachment to host cells